MIAADGKMHTFFRFMHFHAHFMQKSTLRKSHYAEFVLRVPRTMGLDQIRMHHRAVKSHGIIFCLEYSISCSNYFRRWNIIPSLSVTNGISVFQLQACGYSNIAEYSSSIPSSWFFILPSYREAKTTLTADLQNLQDFI